LSGLWLTAGQWTKRKNLVALDAEADHFTELASAYLACRRSSRIENPASVERIHDIANERLPTAAIRKDQNPLHCENLSFASIYHAKCHVDLPSRQSAHILDPWSSSSLL
jgi:hypothetical protein